MQGPGVIGKTNKGKNDCFLSLIEPKKGLYPVVSPESDFCYESLVSTSGTSGCYMEGYGRNCFWVFCFNHQKGILCLLWKEVKEEKSSLKFPDSN
jgi:hypothetical protein